VTCSKVCGNVRKIQWRQLHSEISSQLRTWQRNNCYKKVLQETLVKQRQIRGIQSVRSTLTLLCGADYYVRRTSRNNNQNNNNIVHNYTICIAHNLIVHCHNLRARNFRNLQAIQSKLGGCSCWKNDNNKTYKLL